MKVASDGQVPVGELLGQEEQRPGSRWRAALRWRDWNLPVKLGAVTLIPIIIAVVLGAVTLASRIDLSARYGDQRQLAEAGAAGRTLLDALQEERTVTAGALTAGTGLGSAELRAARSAVDRARAPLGEAVAAADDRLSAAGAKLDEQLDALAGIRKRLGAGQLDAVEAIEAYTKITDAVLELDTVVVAGIGAEGLGATSDAAHSLLVAQEEISVHRALIAHGIAFGLSPSEFNAVRTADVRRSDRVTEFFAAATEGQRARFDDTVRGREFDEYVRIVDALLSSQDAGSELFSSTSAEHWSKTTGAVLTAMDEVAEQLGDELTDGTEALVDDADTGVGALAIVLFVALVLAALVVFHIARQLLRSLRLLRTSALEVAQHDLPDAVQAIQEGHTDDTEINQVPVHSRDEIGEVARAFDAVHSEALRLAAEQAGMRAGYASVFVNLSRRSQSLVQRQLQLIERLERDEEDADQLATLFQLDHLATRMRRNNENLMVLSGAESTRRSGQPVSATDVLRAAVSEIEQYQRVDVRTPPAVSVVGYAAGDLIRLVAELLDNATAFSAPETKVTVATQQLDDASLSIDILDKGIGMNSAEVAEANERLAQAGTDDLTTSRRMGLFVVGRLAGRHGFGVELHGGKDIAGVRATVTVPGELVGDRQSPYLVAEPAASRPAEPVSFATDPAAEHDSDGPVSHPTASGGALPKRAPRAGGFAPTASGVTARGGDGGFVPEETENEMTGTALFTPLGWDDGAQPRGSATRHDTRPDSATPADDRAERSPAFDVGTESPAWPSEAQAARQAEDDDPPAAADPGAHDGQQLSGSQLFQANSSTAVSDWWSTAVTESNAGAPTEAQRRARKAAVENAETTPIFDEMVSAWFRKVTDAVGSAPAPGEDNWEFAADETWKTVQEVSQREAPAEYTDAGLPRRRRGERLLPGSAVSEDGKPVESADPPQRRPRDPADVLGRLSSFQQGVTRGRRHRLTEETEEPTDSYSTGPTSTSVPESGETAAGLPKRSRRTRRPGPAEPAPEETTDIVADGGGLFTDATQPATDSSRVGSDSPPEREADPDSAEESTSSWAFATDARWSEVEQVSRSVPTSYTQAGLPRRQRGERLLPGSAAPDNQLEPRRRSRDPADVRGRLASFQQGVRRGRHRTAGEADDADDKLEGQ